MIEDVELVPGRRPAAVLEDGGGRARLAVAGWSADDGEPVVEGLGKGRAGVVAHADLVKARPEVLRLDSYLSCSLVRHSRPQVTHWPARDGYYSKDTVTKKWV